MKTAAMFGAAILSLFGLQSGSSTSPSISNSTSCVHIERTLFIGSTGADVVALQKFLMVKPTGYFGPATKQKLIEWQIAHTLIRTAKAEGAGTTGPKTRNAMRCTSQSTSIQSPVVAPPIIQPAVAATTSNTLQVPANTAPAAPSNSGSAGSSIQASCPVQGSMPSAASCTTGVWTTVQDEGGCSVWYCSDPTNDLQG